MQTETQVKPMVWTVAPQASDWQTGFDLFLAGKSESYCANIRQIEGWWYANHCAGCAAVVDAQMEQRESYQDWRYPVRQGF